MDAYSEICSRVARRVLGVLTAVTLLAAAGADARGGAAGAGISLDPFTLPIEPAPSGSGELAPLLGVNIHFTRDDAGLDAAASAGFAWVRMDLTWAEIETAPGIYSFEDYDSLLDDLAARGMRALLILDYGNPLYTGGANLPPTTATAVRAFGDFAEEAARHFAGYGVRYEIWNEPNSDRFWPPEPDAGQYADLAAEAITRVHAGDPAATVATGGLAGMDDLFLFEYLLAGGGTGADGIGCHPYRSDAPEDAIGDVQMWRLIVAQLLPSNPPLLSTEWGYSSTWYGDGHSAAARERQAIMAARELLTTWSQGFPLMIYYDLRDDGSDGAEAEHNFGLLAQDYADKPAMQAVRTLSAAATGRQYAGLLELGLTNMYAMRLDGPADVIVAFWMAAGNCTLLVAPGTTAYTFLGEQLALRISDAQLACPVSESAGPVYLRFTRTNSIPHVAGSGRVVDDYDGDRCADPAQFEAVTGSWTIWLSGVGYAMFRVAGFLGQTGDVAAVADYDGDGLADPAVYRPAFEMLVARLSAWSYQQVEMSLATEADEVWPVPADYDGDGLADPAFYATSTGQWMLWLSGMGYVPASVSGFAVGADQPQAADFDGDQRADPALCAAAGVWRVWLSGAGYASVGPFNSGVSAMIPTAADFDGDGLADPAGVVSNTFWHAWCSSDQYRHYGPMSCYIPNPSEVGMRK